MERIIMKKKIGIVLGICLFIVGMLGIGYATLNPYRGTLKQSVQTKPLDEILTAEQVKEDIEFAMDTMRQRHPAWLEENNENVSKVEKQYETELENIGESITVLEEWKALGRIMHVLEDGHTQSYVNNPEPKYINDFAQFKEDRELLAINGEPIEDVFQRFLTVFQYEREEYARAVFDNNVICNQDNLNWCGVDTSDGVTLTFKTEDGEQDYHYNFVSLEEVKGRTQGSDNEKWVDYTIDEDAGVGIFTLTSCNYNKEYKEVVKAFFEEVSEKNIQNIIVDLRWNGGGSSLVGDEFLKYVNVDGYYTWASEIRLRNHLIKNKRSYKKNAKRNPMFDGNLYVLTNLKSYSAAMDFAMMVKDNQIGTLVGEASGNMPDSYGDCLKFAVPNSQLNFQVSYKRWHRIDESKEGKPLEPDYPCKSAEAMDKVYELIGVK
ncbi:MAG: S41 family peptidase [Eubacteriales bacterium]|nr:S41 family peptidase [Eubacteriales bacterium]